MPASLVPLVGRNLSPVPSASPGSSFYAFSSVGRESHVMSAYDGCGTNPNGQGADKGPDRHTVILTGTAGSPIEAFQLIQTIAFVIAADAMLIEGTKATVS